MGHRPNRGPRSDFPQGFDALLLFGKEQRSGTAVGLGDDPNFLFGLG